MPTTYPLVSTKWLGERIDDPDLVILESSIFLEKGTASSPVSKFRSGVVEFESEGRIPGARFADLFSAFSDPQAPFPFTRPQREQFDAAASSLGIHPNTHVVIYDRLAGQWASRLWWVFRSHGHDKVSVLDGGFKKYRKEERAVETGPARSFTNAAYQSSCPTKYVAFQQDVKDIVDGQREGALICLLKRDDYSGAISVRSRAGHIPGSVNLPFTQLLNDSDNTLRDVAELRSAFSSVLPLDGRLVITYCGGGIASTLGALALAVIGYSNTMEYDGSLVEWIGDPASPLELGHS
jgi:thiosulfate/3-mercaptopyruvate sulfurtransferase